MKNAPRHLFDNAKQATESGNAYALAVEQSHFTNVILSQFGVAVIASPPSTQGVATSIYP